MVNETCNQGQAADITNTSFLSYPCAGVRDIADITSELSETPVRVVTYNIHGWRDTFHVDNLDRVISTLSRVNADVIALQEVLHPYRPPTDDKKREAYFQRVAAGKGNGYRGADDNDDNKEPYLNVLATALGVPYFSFGEATADGYFGIFGYGNAILSRFPIVREQHYVVRPAAKHRAGRRIEAEDRCISAVTFALSTSLNYSICVTHLDQLSDDLRLEQVQRMLATISAVGNHVLCGDFNVFQRADCSPKQWQAILDDAATKGWPSPAETTTALKAVFASGYRDCFYLSDNHRLGKLYADDADRAAAAEAKLSEDTVHPGATCWVTKPLLRIDYAFLAPSAAVGGTLEAGTTRVPRYQRIMDEGSDHFAILIDLVLPALADADAAAPLHSTN